MVKTNMKYTDLKKIILTLLLIISYSCSDDELNVPVVDEEQLDISDRLFAGGATTTFSTSYLAYGERIDGLSSGEIYKHDRGDVLFEANFVKAPNPVRPGLGPVYNNRSCESCHPRDGRAPFPSSINDLSGFFLRISIPGTNEHGGPKPDPFFGDQIQNQAVYGFQPEARFKVTHTQITETLADGTQVVLKKPNYSLIDIHPLAKLPASYMLSPRIGRPVFGLGLLESIPVQDILSREDPTDKDGNGIKGIANWVWDEVNQKMDLGRFGWKGNNPTVLVQTIGALHGDMGITSSYRPYENNPVLLDGLDDDPEISDEHIGYLEFYCRTLAVPAPRNINNSQVKKGAALFEKLDCAVCHTPKQKTGYNPVSTLSYQTFYPYTDMLLHDMGENLADNRPDFRADGTMWKTPPLWGIGLTYKVNSHTMFLHDGRANNLTEAILWHGGEAQTSKEKFKALSIEKRESLLAFLNSL